MSLIVPCPTMKRREKSSIRYFFFPLFAPKENKILIFLFTQAGILLFYVLCHVLCHVFYIMFYITCFVFQFFFVAFSISSFIWHVLYFEFLLSSFIVHVFFIIFSISFFDCKQLFLSNVVFLKILSYPPSHFLWPWPWHIMTLQLLSFIFMLGTLPYIFELFM